jgi:Protein of unknown function (DUF732)
MFIRAAVFAFAAGVATALMLSSGVAHADSNDDAYLAALRRHNISSSGGDQEMIKLGHMICGLLADGYSENALLDMGELHGTHLSSDDVKVIVHSAEAAYCPESIS